MDPTLVRPPPPIPAMALAAIRLSMEGAHAQKIVPTPAKRIGMCQCCVGLKSLIVSVGRPTEEEEGYHHGSSTTDNVAQAAFEMLIKIITL
jgi:hypothetical protein